MCKRSENDVPRFCRANRRRDRFQVPHFTDQDTVWVLTQRSSNRFRETRHVNADFALVDRRLLVVVIKLDRILDRDNVVVVPLVDEIDQTGQRRTFA